MFKRFAAVCVAAVLYSVASLSAGAAELKDFYGEWVGSGVAFDDTDPSMRRDSFVSVMPEGDGFVVAWTTQSVQRDAERNMDVYRNKATRRNFQPTERPGIFEANMERVATGYHVVSCWAYVKDSALVVVELLRQDDGTYTMSNYAREIDGDDMKVTFTRITDGELVRRATLDLRKIED